MWKCMYGHVYHKIIKRDKTRSWLAKTTRKKWVLQVGLNGIAIGLFFSGGFCFDLAGLSKSTNMIVLSEHGHKQTLFSFRLFDWDETTYHKAEMGYYRIKIPIHMIWNETPILSLIVFGACIIYGWIAQNLCQN